jgi:hypothetical protein
MKLIPMAQFLWRVPLKVSSVQVGRNPMDPDDDCPQARHFLVRAEFNGRSVRFPVSMTHPEEELPEPTPFLAATALHRVCGILGQAPGYREWCRTMQVDPHLARAADVWGAHREIEREVRRLLGPAYEEFVEDVVEAPEEVFCTDGRDGPALGYRPFR